MEANRRSIKSVENNETVNNAIIDYNHKRMDRTRKAPFVP